MYWENQQDVRNELIASSMPVKRFEEILKHIHLCDNQDINPNDKMAKLRPLISSLNEKYLLYWPDTQNMDVDESMVPYYGRYPSKQYIKNKPIRYGYKIWCLNSPSGYLIQFEPYQGAGSVTIQHALAMGGSVVMDLLKELPAKPYHVFFDNLFSSLRLFGGLKAIGMSGTGTLRQNRVQKCPVSDVAVM